MFTMLNKLREFDFIQRSDLISLAMFWASAAAPYSPLLDNPAQNKPFFPFQWFG